VAIQTGSEQDLTVEAQIDHLRELFADAPEVGRKAFENVFENLTAQASQTPPPPVESRPRWHPHRQGLGCED
jgi:hypothetical protein